MTQSRDEWLLERRNYIGASDIGALLLDHDGHPIHPYKTPHDLWLDKKGLSNFNGNERTDMGLMLEPVIAAKFKMVNPGVKVKKGKTVYGEKPHHASNPDLIVMGRVSQVPGMSIVEPNKKGYKCLVQMKSAGFYSAKDFGIDGTDEVPDWYNAQVQWEMYTAGADMCVIALLFDTHLYHQFIVYRDEELINILKGYADHFWQSYVLADREPPVTGHKKDTEWLNGAWEAKNEGVMIADPETDVTVQEFAKVTAEKERIDNLHEGLKNKLKAVMGENACLMTSIGELTWRADKNGRRAFKITGIKSPKERVA